MGAIWAVVLRLGQKRASASEDAPKQYIMLFLSLVRRASRFAPYARRAELLASLHTLGKCMMEGVGG